MLYLAFSCRVFVKFCFSLTKCGFAVVYPLEGPVCLPFHTRHGLNGIKQIVPKTHKHENT